MYYLFNDETGNYEFDFTVDELRVAEAAADFLLDFYADEEIDIDDYGLYELRVAGLHDYGFIRNDTLSDDLREEYRAKRG